MLNFNIEALSHISVNNPSYYFTTYHFTEDEIEYLLNFPTSSCLTYKELFDIFIRNKLEKNNTDDIAPFIYKSFGIGKNFNRDVSFIKNAKKFKGLDSKKRK